MSGTAGEPTGPRPGTAIARDPEEAIIERAGYKPELRRSLKYFSMFAIAFSIISITTGIFLNYGFGLSYWGPASIWTWPTYGWFVGFAGLLYMTVGGGAIMLTVAAPLLLSEFNDTTPSPHLVLTVTILLMLAPVVFNIISIQVAARVNNIAVFTEIIGTVVFGAALFVLWGVRSRPSPYGFGILTRSTPGAACRAA